MIDPRRLSQLFETHAGALMLFARQWRDRAAAEDVVQEVFVRLLLQPLEPRRIRPWLFKAVRNEAIAQARSGMRRQRREHNAMQPALFESRVSDLIDGSSAALALERLPGPQRQAIVLRIWGQMTLKEAAAVMELPTSTVFDLYRAGLAALQEDLGAICPDRHS